jgi:hypothetical protein
MCYASVPKNVRTALKTTIIRSHLNRPTNRFERFSITTTREVFPRTSSSFLRLLTRTHSTQVRLFDTVNILRPQWWHLSPCLGAALHSSPLKNNLLRLAESIRESEKIKNGSPSTTKDHKQNSQKTFLSPLEGPGKLLKCLFFQPQPGAPIRFTKSKSMAAAYFTPQIMGTLMGTALLSKKKELSEEAFRRILLDRHNIKSNHVQGRWTGVSLARWKEIVNHLRATQNGDAASLTSDNDEYAKLEGLLTAAVWSMAVWECCHSRQCILSYLLSVQQVSGRDIINPANRFVQNSIDTNPQAQSTWISMEGYNEQGTGTEDDSTNLIQSSLERLLLLLQPNNSTASQDPTDTERMVSLEKARAIENLCTSIVRQQQSDNLKPTTPNGYYGFDGGVVKPDCVEVAIRELIDYLLWDDQKGLFDISRLPPSSSPELVSFYKTHSAVEGGEEWFQMLSGIADCSYLSVSPTGRHYELTPTLRNMAKVCQRLLYKNGSPEEDWESLARLQDIWHLQDLRISFDILSQKAKMSSDIYVHEVAMVKRKGKKNAIEIRLRCDWARNTGFATVTHLRFKTKLIDKELSKQILETTFRRQIPLVHFDVACMLALALLEDFGVFQDQSCCNLSELVAVLLGCLYGVDRQELLHITATSDLEREEAALAKAQRENEKVLLYATLKVCKFLGDNCNLHDVNPGVHLLHWLLSESTQMGRSINKRSVLYPEMEQALLNLPDAVKYSECTKQRISNNWAVRGYSLRGFLDWRSGEVSLRAVMTNLKLLDWPRFVLLNMLYR